MTLGACTGGDSDDSSPTPDTDAPPADASLTVDYNTDVGTIDQHQLMNVAQGGYRPMQNPRWFADQAAQLSEIGVRQVRLDHVFDDPFYHVVQRGADGSLSFDFATLDSVLLPLVENGLTPFICLSYMPAAMGPDDGPPTSFEEWKALVSAAVSHYRDLGHTGWSWEVWNEPDNETDSFWTGTPEQYQSLYVASAEAVRAADPTALVGGGVAAQYSNFSLNATFLDFLKANPEVPLDFYSYHAYLTDDFTADGVVSPAAATVRADLDAIGRSAAKLLITEWNQSPVVDGRPGAPSDTNAGASSLARRLITAVGSDLDEVYRFSVMDGARPNREFNGDLGLFTVTGHRKAAGNAFAMFSKLGSTRLSATMSTDDLEDVNGIASRNPDTDETTVLLYNASDENAAIAVDVKNLPYAKTPFSVTQTRVSETEGNYFAKPGGSRPGQSENAPVLTETVEKAATSHSITVELPSDSVTLVTLRPSDLPVGTVANSPQPIVTNAAPEPVNLFEAGSCGN